MLVRSQCRYTTHKVLTMDFIRGTKISNRDEILKMGLNPLNVADTVMSLFGHMIFWDGFIHRSHFTIKATVRTYGSIVELSDSAVAIVVILTQGT